jgi:hypothetical protein
MLEELRGLPDELAQEPSMFVEHPSECQRRPSALVGHRYEDVGMLLEERRKPSELVGAPETQREMPSSFAGMLSAFGQQP